MARTALSSRGQVVIPKEIRDRCGWSPGTDLEVEEIDGVVHLRPTRAASEFSAGAIFGCIPYGGPPVSVEEMHAGIDRMFQAEHGRD